MTNDSRRPGARRSRFSGGLLTLVISELTVATAYIHLNLGGTLFTFNGLGFLGLGAAYLLVAAAPIAAFQRFGWLPRIGLAGYALLTIVSYLVIGPWISLGWIAKAIEMAIVALVVVDLLDLHETPSGVARAIVDSFAPLR